MKFDAVHLKELMIARGVTLAVAESLTSGRIQAAIGSASGEMQQLVAEFVLGQLQEYIEGDGRHSVGK